MNVNREDVSSFKKQALYFMGNPDQMKNMGERARQYVTQVFDRNKIAEGLYDELQNM